MERLEKVLSAIDHIHATDPNLEMVNGTERPKEALYAERMTQMLNGFESDPSELLQIATRGQHIKRWEIPREDYPMDRKGYLKWRTDLKILHADLLEELMKGHGYGPTEIKHVRNLVMKTKLKTDHESQVLEDVTCLVFLQFYLDEFLQDHDETKVVSILQKTWGKMSESGRDAALALQLPGNVQAIVGKALA